MRTLLNLPPVTCRFGLSDGVADIKVFQTAAAAADWTRNEINVAVVRAVYESPYFDDVGQVLYRYCASARRLSRSADASVRVSFVAAATT
jgi:hypothetical protein